MIILMSSIMIVLIPLGGFGRRFKELGYTTPKTLINVMGKPIIEWLINSLYLDKIQYLLIPYNHDLAVYNFEERLKKKYPLINFIFHKLNTPTEGACDTIKRILENVSIPDQPIICIDGDGFYRHDIISDWHGSNTIFVFNDNSHEEIYSYISCDGNKITDIREKEKISSLASSGAYGFESWKMLLEYIKRTIQKGTKHKNEYYTSSVIKEMLLDGNVFTRSIIQPDSYICLGTPLHLRVFCNNYPRINAISHKSMMSQQRYCFDLDAVITDPGKQPKPHTENIEFLRYIKKLGNTVIINVCSCSLGSGEAEALYRILEELGIPYDELYFGRPSADYHIGPRMISSDINLEKELGFYRSRIEARDFNHLSLLSLNVYRKESNDLSGEIHYYNNIPSEIKDMFPMMIKFDPGNGWYDIEYINGIPVSRLYLSEQLTIEQFNHILGSLNRIQSAKMPEDDIDLYANYIDKLEERYDKYDYTVFPGSESLYARIHQGLSEYRSGGRGKRKVIHGDPVLTNILINQFGKIKFIDMRGKQGKTLSITGDWLYDWAKLYQSLIGYDEVLIDRKIDTFYKKMIIDHFREYFVSENGAQAFEDLRLITKSLLFTLIPLHNNEKCIKYYDLINMV